MGHDHAIPNAEYNEKRLKLVLFLTGTFLIAEVIGGFATGSLALLSDAAHMLTDVMALVLSLLAIRIGRREADSKRTYGYKRFEILAAALNAVVLFLIAFYILYEAYQRFQNPPDIKSGGMMIIAVLGLVVNVISLRLLTAGSEHSLNVKSAYLEVLSDAVGSIGVILAAIIIRYTGWWQVDPILAVLIGFWILPRTWHLLSESVNVLLEGVPHGLELNGLLNDLKAIEGIVDIHDLHVWSITTGLNAVTAHLVIVDQNHNAILKQAEEVAAKHGIQHSTFQLEIKDNNPTHTIHH